MSFIDPIMSPFLALPPFWSIFILSLLISLVITIIYKYMTNQPLMKSLKEEMKKYQAQMKKEKDSPEKMLAIQKKAMDANMKYMMESFKPTLVTFIPIIIVFGWMSANFAAEPLTPGSEFDITVILKNNVYGTIELIVPEKNNSISLTDPATALRQINQTSIMYHVKAYDAGKWNIITKVNNKTEYPAEVIISQSNVGKEKFTSFTGKEIKSIQVGYPKKQVLNIFGFELGWLGTYIILSILFSLGLRRLMNLA